MDSAGLITVTSYPTTRYGDWVAPEGSATSTMINSFFWIKQLRIMTRYALLLNLTSDAQWFIKLSSKAVSAYNVRFYDPQNKTYHPTFEPTRWATGNLSLQTALALPLALGIVPSADIRHVSANLAALVKASDWHPTTGSL